MKKNNALSERVATAIKVCKAKFLYHLLVQIRNFSNSELNLSNNDNDIDVRDDRL